MKKLFRRENYLTKIRPFYHTNDIIKVITGIRRCGKSSILELIKDEIIEGGVNISNIIYLDLEKRGYKNIKTPDALESLIVSSSKGIKGTKYLFVDEIQNVKGYEDVINGFRKEDDYSIFITGSNSYLLSGELMTKLTGRYMEFEIFTLTFEEYISMKKYYSMPINSNLIIELDNYINEGGFPRTLFFDDIVSKRTYVQEIVNEIFKKDIKKRVKIKNINTFNLVRDYVMNNYGATTSINNIAKALNKSGTLIRANTLSKYIEHLVNAKLLYPCDRFDMKSKRMLSGEKKYYLGDLSLSFVTNPDSRINYGPALENIIFQYCKSKDYEVSIGRIGKLECDFILKDKFLNYSYVQVAYSILQSKETEDREYKPLESIRDNYPKYVLTTDYLLQKRNGIIHENVLEFISNGKMFYYS